MTAYALADMVQVTGSIVAVTPPSDTVAGTSFDASTSDQLLAGLNRTRKGVTVANDPATNGYLYLNLGLAATTSSYATVLWPGSYWEAPYGYVGAVHGIFTTTTGSCRVTEYT